MGELTKNLAEKLMNIQGEARGITFKTDANFVLAEYGRTALDKVEALLAKVGQSFKYGRIQSMAFYPIGLRILSLLAIKEALNLPQSKIQEMGARAPKESLLIKLFMKFFLSLQSTKKQVPLMWQKHYTKGELTAEPHEKERYIVVRLKGLTLHPLFCVYLKGYLGTIAHMVVKQPVRSQETECPFQGGQCHRFLMKW
jgi:hypothetical protein